MHKYEYVPDGNKPIDANELINLARQVEGAEI